MIGRNLNDLEEIEKALMERASRLRSLRRLPRGSIVYDVAISISRCESLIADCKSAFAERLGESLADGIDEAGQS